MSKKSKKKLLSPICPFCENKLLLYRESLKEIILATKKDDPFFIEKDGKSTCKFHLKCSKCALTIDYNSVKELFEDIKNTEEYESGKPSKKHDGKKKSEFILLSRPREK